jgi:hypothetical protein
MAPRVPALGKAVAQHHKRPFTHLGEMEIDAVRLHGAMRDAADGLCINRIGGPARLVERLVEGNTLDWPRRPDAISMPRPPNGTCSCLFNGRAGPQAYYLSIETTRPPILRYFGPMPQVGCFSRLWPDRPRIVRPQAWTKSVAARRRSFRQSKKLIGKEIAQRYAGYRGHNAPPNYRF